MGTVSWAEAVSGNWSDAADWKTGKVPGESSAVRIAVPGAYTLTLDVPATIASLAISDTGATFDISNPLTVSGITNLTGGTMEVAVGGTITGGTIEVGGDARLDGDGGTLAGVTVDGVLGLNATDGSLTIADGITFDGVDGTGPGAINLSGNGASLMVEGTTTLDNATITISSNLATTTLAAEGDGTPAILTLGSSLSIVDSGGGVLLTDGGDAGDGIVNLGTITDANAGGLFEIDGNSFTNDGSMTAYEVDIDSDNAFNSGNISVFVFGLLELNSESATNSGGISAPEYGTVAFNGTNFTNTGDLAASDASTLEANGANFTNRGSVTVSDTGVLEINGGSFDNTDSGSLTFDSTSTLEIANGATLTNAGTINFANGATLELSNDGTLTTAQLLAIVQYVASGAPVATVLLNDGTNLDNSGATLDIGTGAGIGALMCDGTITGGTIDNQGGNFRANILSSVNFSGGFQLGNLQGTTIVEGINFEPATAAANIEDVTGLNSALYVDGTTTLNNATINIGSFAQHGGTLASAEIGGPAVLTLGNALFLTLADSGNPAEPDFAFLGDAGNAGDGIVNDGVITAAELNGEFTIFGNSFTNDGTIAVSNYSIFEISSTTLGNFADSTLSGGTWTVDANATLLLTYEDISTLDANLTLSGADAVFAYGTYINYTTLDSTLTTIASGGALNLLDGRNFSTPAAFTDDGLLQLANSNFTAASLAISSSGSVELNGSGTIDAGTGPSDGIINKGSIEAESSGGQFTIGGNEFTNDGSITVSNDDTLIINAADFSNFSQSTLTGGAWVVDAGSTLQLADQDLTSLAGNLTLSGAGSVVQSLLNGNYTPLDTTLTTIASGGVLTLLAGRNFTTTKTITDNGALILSASNFQDAALTISNTGALVGNGTVTGHITDSGTIEAAGGTLTLASAVAGPGQLVIEAGATLVLSTTLGARQSIDFAGTGATLMLDHPASAAQTLTGFGAGDQLDLAGVTVTSTSISGATLTVNTHAHSYDFSSSASLAGDVAVTTPDGNGGTDVELAQASTITLTSADQTVTVGADAGAVTIVATSSLAGALMVGNNPATTELAITGSGTIKLNAADTGLTVQLQAASTVLTLSKMAFVTADGSSGSDTITAGAANQTLIGGAGDKLIGYSGFGDSFMGTAVALDGDIIKDFGGSDVIYLTDVDESSVSLKYSGSTTAGKLTVSDGVHTAAIDLTAGTGFSLSAFTPSADGTGTLISFT